MATGTTISATISATTMSADIQIDMPPNTLHPVTLIKCEKYINTMFKLTLIPVIQHKNKAIKWTVFVLTNAILFSSTFSLLFYPSYYPTQGVVWTFDLVLGCIVYNYLFYLHTKWAVAGCFEGIEVTKSVNAVSMTFYWLYMLYWLYFAVIQFNTHNDNNVLIQFGNILMSASWYLFFSTISAAYYFICVKLSQRAKSIKKWLIVLREDRPLIDDFYKQYDEHYMSTLHLSNHWNLLILIGILLQSCHIPIDLLSVIYNKFYYDIFGAVVKTLSLMWYLLRICDLNEFENTLIAWLYEYRLYDHDTLKDIKIYASYRPLGLDFYGIKVNRSFLVKIGLLVLNLALPTIYAIVSSKLF